jgi:MFS family permease
VGRNARLVGAGGGLGRAYGFERAGDNLGAGVGPLLAAGLVASVGIRHVLYLSVIPGAFAALAIAIAAAEARRHRISTVRRRARLELDALHEAGVLRPLLPIADFELGNVATSLLILRGFRLLSRSGLLRTRDARQIEAGRACENTCKTNPFSLLRDECANAERPAVVCA